MKDLKNIKYWLFDLDNTLYDGATKVFDQVDKKMSKFISKKLNVDLKEVTLPLVSLETSSFLIKLSKIISLFNLLDLSNLIKSEFVSFLFIAVSPINVILLNKILSEPLFK